MKEPGYTVPGYLSMAAAAKWAGVSVKTLVRWFARGLPFYQSTPRGKRLIRPSDIDSFLIRRQTDRAAVDRMVEEVLHELGEGNGSNL